MTTDDHGPSPAQLGQTMTVTPGEWTPLDDHGTQIYAYPDGSDAVTHEFTIAVQTADDTIRRLRAELESARTVIAHVDTWRHGGGEPGYDAAQAVIDAYDEHAGREFAAGSKPTVVLTGDTGGGRREFGIHVGGRDLGGFGYQDCGWAFQDHKPIIRDLAEALGAQVDDRTT